MADADACVLRAVQETLLDPRVVQEALEYAEREILRDSVSGQLDALAAELADVEAAARRLTAAIAQGKPLDSLVTALEANEQQRRDLQARLDALRQPQPTWDVKEVRAKLRGYVSDWQKLLRGHVQAQQVLRRLVKGRLTFTPHIAAKGRSYYTFEGIGTMQPLLAGVVRNLASPPGFEPGS